MGREMGFCGREAERVKLKKEHKVQIGSPSPNSYPAQVLSPGKVCSFGANLEPAG